MAAPAGDLPEPPLIGYLWRRLREGTAIEQHFSEFCQRKIGDDHREQDPEERSGERHKVTEGVWQCDDSSGPRDSRKVVAEVLLRSVE